MLAQIGYRRLDKYTSQSVTREQRPTRLTAHSKRLANKCTGQFGRTHAWGDIERSKQQGFKQALINRPSAIDHLSDRLVGRGPGETGKRQIIDNGGLRDSPILIEYPPGKSAVAETQDPLLAAWEVNEGKLRFIRPDQAGRGPNRRDKRQRSMIARQQQMGAVVDHHVGGLVKIRTASAAGIGGRFVNSDRPVRPGQTEGGR